MNWELIAGLVVVAGFAVLALVILSRKKND